MITLRPYQEQAVSAVTAAMGRDRYVLLQAATGAGKTIVFCEAIRRWLRDFNMRIAILAHRRELITQARNKLLTVWPQAPIGIACAGVSKEVDVDQPVVIGSIQTLTRRAGETEPFDLIIIDEAHRIPARGEGISSQYHSFLQTMENYNPRLRVWGVTATPFRLGHGYIYGRECRPGRTNLFPSLCYRIGISDLQARGFLCPVRAKEAEDIRTELAAVRTSGGEYRINDLSDLMSKPAHVGSAVKAYTDYGEDRGHVLVFCVTIDHAEKVQEAFREAGYTSGCVHSRMSLRERDRVLSDFAEGRVRVLTNVGVLTEGWDCPQTDLILLCRPTKSPALFVQMIGRGTRTAPDKEDLLVLDLAGNYRAHGDPDSPIVDIPSGAPKESDEPPGREMKVCPECNGVSQLGSMICPDCGYEWPRFQLAPIDQRVRMKDISFEPETYDLVEAVPTEYESRAGNRMLKVELDVRPPGGNIPMGVNHFLDIEGNAHPYAQRKAMAWWEEYAGTEYPETIARALDMWWAVTLPRQVQVKQDGKYLKVVGW